MQICNIHVCMYMYVQEVRMSPLSVARASYYVMLKKEVCTLATVQLSVLTTALLTQSTLSFCFI